MRKTHKTQPQGNKILAKFETYLYKAFENKKAEYKKKLIKQNEMFEPLDDNFEFKMENFNFLQTEYDLVATITKKEILGRFPKYERQLFEMLNNTNKEQMINKLKRKNHKKFAHRSKSSLYSDLKKISDKFKKEFLAEFCEWDRN